VIRIPTLIIDSSEAGIETGEKVKKYFEKHEYSVMVKTAQADYVWAGKEGETVCVERTTPGDFWNKVTTGRLFEQLESELEACDRLYYVIADYSDYSHLLRRTMRDIDSSFTGALTSVAKVAHLVPVWYGERFPHWLLLTFEKEAGLREPGKVGRTPRKRDRTAWDVAVDMLVALPYVGRTRAEEIANEVGSIRELLLKLANQPLQFLARFLSLKQARELEALINQDYFAFKECKRGNNNSEGGGLE
jgi:ERCC4-type nuclease